MKELGKLSLVPIKSVWEREPVFSAWLADDDNIALLGEAIDIDLSILETEAEVGEFSADILAKEDNGEGLVIIENQYDDTDHDHLGKLITYAAGKRARILVWVVEKAREEHRAAVQWLNDNTGTDIGVFLVKIEVYAIGDSKPAPKFTVLESPNNWVKTTRQNTSHNSEWNLKQADWWTDFTKYAKEQPDFKKHFKLRKVRPQHWFDISTGINGCYIRLTITKTKLGTEFYISTTSRSNNKEIFNTLLEHKESIEKDLGFEMDWQELPERIACRIIVTFPGDFTKTVENEKYFKWYCENAIALKSVFPKYLKKK